MIFIFCEIHGMNGQPVGGKMFIIPTKLKGVTVKLWKKVYANIVEVNGKLRKLGGE